MYCAPQTVKPGYGPAYLACYFVLTRCYTLTWVRKFCCGPYQMFTPAAGSPPLCVDRWKNVGWKRYLPQTTPLHKSCWAPLIYIYIYIHVVVDKSGWVRTAAQPALHFGGGAIFMNFYSMTPSWCLLNRDTTFSQAVTDKVLFATFPKMITFFLIRPVTRECRYGRNFVVKWWGDDFVRNQYSHRVDSEVQFYKYRFHSCFLEMFWKQHQSRFVLTDDLQNNILKFVTVHGLHAWPHKTASALTSKSHELGNKYNNVNIQD